MHDYLSGREEIIVDGLIEEQRRLSASQNPFDRVVGTLCVAGLLKQKLTALTDDTVGQLMFDHVWSEMDIFAPELVICEAATVRLLGRPVQDGKDEWTEE